jgi:UDP-glucose 4-epimerase
MKVLITGALGYIGSHTSLELAKKKYDLVLLDNLSNSNYKTLAKLRRLSSKNIPFEKADIRDLNLITEIIEKYKINTVFHFAGLKSPSESIDNPDKYHDINVKGSISLIKSMEEVIKGKKTFIFSSSAAVYGVPKYLPIDENHPLNPISPYGSTKIEVEKKLKEIFSEKKNWSIACLRYFNPAGSEDTFSLGENLENLPNNLMPLLSMAANKEIPFLKVYGNDYNTIDGTGVRDYIHILDLVDGHIEALSYLEENSSVFEQINLGTGKGKSVLDAINSFIKTNNINVPYEIYPRRGGDSSSSYADVKKAEYLLGWKSKRSFEQMCSSSWQFKKRS